MSVFDALKNFHTQQMEQAKGILTTVGKFTPGRELARGIGISFASFTAQKQQEELDRQQRELDDLFLKKIKTSTGDDKKRLIEVARKAGSANIIGEAISEAPTTRQVLASAGELALFAALGAKPPKTVGLAIKPVSGAVIRATQATTKAAKLAGVPPKLQKAYKITKFGAKLLREAGLGASFFGLIEATEEDATTQSIIKAAETGAIFGPVTFGALTGLGKLAQIGMRKLGPPMQRGVQKGIERLEKVATGEPTEKIVAGTKNQIQRTLSYIGESVSPLKRKTAERAVQLITGARKLKQRLIDRFSSLQRIENQLMEVKGRPLKESEKIYRDARLLQSTADASAERKVNNLLAELQPSADIREKYTAYITQLDFIDRARLGQTVPGNQTKDQLVKGLFNIVKEIGPDDMKRVAQTRQSLRNYHVGLLQERVNAGVISQEMMDNLMKTHRNYIPHNVMMDIEERSIRGLSQSFNVPKTDIMRAVGSTRKIQDPIAATIQRTPLATRTIEKNKLLNNLISVQEQSGMIPGMKLVSFGPEAGLRGEKIIAKIPPGYDTITLFKNGVKQTWQVPGDIAQAIKNTDAPLTPAWWRVITTPQRILKKGATQYNLSFALPNKFRDKQTAAITAEAFISTMAEKTGVTSQKLELGRKEIRELYKMSGGYGASIFREGEERVWSQFNKKGVGKFVSEKVNPIKMIETINDQLETSTRLEVFKKALKRGLSPRDAALVSRDATIDFARMGTWMKWVNQAVPFLNARVQGFINLPRAMVANPEAFARMQMYTAAYPSLLLHAHNRRFDSYKHISQYNKNKYWIIMTGETDGIDEYTGQPIKIPQFVRIPKGEGQALVSGPVQFALEKSDGIDFRKTSEMLADTLGSASPLEFQGFDQANFAGTAISQLGPAATIAVGEATNIHPIFGTPIIPEGRIGAPTEFQFKKSTPEVVKQVSNILGLSPAKVAFWLDTIGAGVSKDIQRAADLAYGVVREGKVANNSVSETPFGALTQIPIARRFLGEAQEFFGPETQFRQQQKEDIEKEVTGERLLIEDKASEIWKEMNKRKTKDERLNYLNSLGNELTPAIKDKIDGWKKSRQTVEVLKKSDSVEVRARYIYQRLLEMAGADKQIRIDYLNELERNKILTTKVKQRIAELKNILNQ